MKIEFLDFLTLQINRSVFAGDFYPIGYDMPRFSMVTSNIYPT